MRIQEVERNEAMSSPAAIRIKEQLALNEMKNLDDFGVVTTLRRSARQHRGR
jgi:hypothetical protein